MQKLIIMVTEIYTKITQTQTVKIPQRKTILPAPPGKKKSTLSLPRRKTNKFSLNALHPG